MTYPDINPVAIQLGPVPVHWYGLMYLIGFIGGWWLGIIRANKPNSGWKPEQMTELLLFISLGVMLGGRLGYILFYNPFLPPEEASKFWEVWKGGMSFHGGLLGVLVALGIYCKQQKRSFFQVTDYIAPFVTIGLGTGRIGNFINGELWGKISDLPWAMQLSCSRFAQFCDAGSEQKFSLPHHPSQLYEFFLEGIVLFVILWTFSSKPRPIRAVSGLFLICYGLFRFVIEFVRLPDQQIGYLAYNWFTYGQALTLPMLVLGIFLFWSAYKNQHVKLNPSQP